MIKDVSDAEILMPIIYAFILPFGIYRRWEDLENKCGPLQLVAFIKS